jgi:hypothetical protein
VEGCSNKLTNIIQSLSHSENLSAENLRDAWKNAPVSAAFNQSDSDSRQVQLDEAVKFRSSVARELFISGLLDSKIFKETLMKAVDGEDPSEEVKELWETSMTGVSIAYLVRLFCKSA